MTTTATRKPATKELTVLARCQFKNNPNAVGYLCLSSNGVDRYETTVCNGHATHCTCPAKKTCYHMTGCEKLEAEREARKLAEQDARYYERAAFDLSTGYNSIVGLY